MNAGLRGVDPAHVASSINHSSLIAHHSVRAVFFDAVGTLIWPEPSVAAAYAAAGHRHGIDLAEQDIWPRFRAALARQDEIDRRVQGGRTSEAREIERWRGIVADVFGGGPHGEAIFADLWDHFARPANWRLFEDAAVAFRQLADQGLIIGIASNFDHRLDSICRRMPPLDDCRHLFVSSRVGWRKPSPQFFATIERELGLEAAELLLVGDDVENDYHAARAAGWQALLVKRS